MIYSQIWTWLSARVRHGFGHSRRIRLVRAGGSGSNNCAQLWLGCSFILPTTLNVTWGRPSQPRKLLGPSASSREPHLSPADGSLLRWAKLPSAPGPTACAVGCILSRLHG